MPIPANAVKIVLAGSMSGGEQWETGFWMTGTGVHDGATANAQAELIWGTLTSSDASGAMRITSIRIWDVSITFSEVRCYLYLDGVHAAAIGSFVPAVPIHGQAPGNIMPHQISACMTLNTGLAGRSHRGRMYLPATALSLSAGGMFQHPDIDPVVAAWATAFTDINAANDGKIVVCSRKLGITTPVSGVAIDSIPDVIRRRAKQLQQQWVQSAAVAPGPNFP